MQDLELSIVLMANEEEFNNGLINTPISGWCGRRIDFNYALFIVLPDVAQELPREFMQAHRLAALVFALEVFSHMSHGRVLITYRTPSTPVERGRATVMTDPL